MSEEEERKSVKSLVMPDQYTGEEDWLDWITNFELCAKINEWDDESKATFLAVRMKSIAQQVYRDLPSTCKDNYEELKAAMATRFGRTKHTELYKAELRFVKRGKNEKLTELANRIRHLACEAYPIVDVTFRDELARDQFMDALDDREFRLKVRQLRPKSLDEAVAFASEIEAMEQAEERKQNKSVHTMDVPSEVLGVNRDESSLILRQSLQIIEQNTAVMRDLLAAMKVGNYGNEASRPHREQFRKSTTGKECFNCGEMGHFIARCPRRQGNGRQLR